jgi:hypothetical protein
MKVNLTLPEYQFGLFLSWLNDSFAKTRPESPTEIIDSLVRHAQVLQQIDPAAAIIIRLDK